MVLTHLNMQSLKAYAEFYASMMKFTKNPDMVEYLYKCVCTEINRRS